MAAALEEKDHIIEQLRTALKTKELILEQDEEERKDYAREAQRAYEKQLMELQQQLRKAQEQVRLFNFTTLILVLTQVCDSNHN